MGPAIFLIWKAALLKKRILIYTPPPVEPACLAVYNICLMATIPSGAATLSSNRCHERVQPLFCVGINDIEHIEALHGGYVACTTDKLFMFKPHLYDVLVDLSAQSLKVQYSTPKLPHPKVHRTILVQGRPTLEETAALATDRQRYFSLLQQLARFRRRQGSLQRRLESASSGSVLGLEIPAIPHGPESLRLHQEESIKGLGLDMAGTLKMMMTGGWWWWYGDEIAEEEEYEPFLQSHPEDEQGGDDVGTPRSSRADQRLGGACLQVLQIQTNGNADTEAIRFFHHLTRTVLSELDRLLSYKSTAAIFEDEPETGSHEASTSQNIILTREDMNGLGVDYPKDDSFVEELSKLYFDTDVVIRGWDLRTCCMFLGSCSPCR
ncbi:hypothetical protein BGZ83_005536 [Gryganskiella cystojenkinii]|nr:hypothetical protein BGZ83_005536 [Gryganskiella cystojenkinii]